MAKPCCLKCANTQFSSSKNLHVKAVLIYCSKCGAVAGAVPITGTSGGGVTTGDDWESRV
jgi:hypothetical protein